MKEKLISAARYLIAFMDVELGSDVLRMDTHNDFRVFDFTASHKSGKRSTLRIG